MVYKAEVVQPPEEPTERTSLTRIALQNLQPATDGSKYRDLL